MNNILAIETSSEACSVALTTESGSLERFEHAPMKHAELVLPMVESLLADAGLSLKQLDAIAFGRGPGSFTGLRIGIGVVQGLAWGAQRPVVPVSSLAAVAQTFFDHDRPGDIRRVCVAMDARMQEVFSARFVLDDNGLAVPECREQVGPPEQVQCPDPASTGAAGNGFERFESLVELGSALAVCEPDCWPQASAVCKLAAGWLEDHDGLPAEQAQPVYIRDNVAKKPGKA